MKGDVGLNALSTLGAKIAAESRAFVARWKRRSSEPVAPHVGYLLAALAAVLLGDVALALAFDAREARAALKIAPAWLDVAQLVTRLGLSGYIFFLSALVALLAVAATKRGRGRLADARLRLLAGRAVFVFCANLFSGIVGSQLIKHLVGRARPPLMNLVGPFHFEPLSFKSTLASFPSGHTITAFTTAYALSLFAPKMKIPLYLIAISVALSRLALRAHYPSDVVAGAAIGLFCTWFAAREFAVRRLVFVIHGGRLRPRGQGSALRIMGDLRRAAP